MLNTDVFKFEFVNRMRERKIVDNFIGNFKENVGYALWINGKSGVGKSFFLTEYIVSQKGFRSIYVNMKAGCNAPSSYLKELIYQISKTADLNFISYLRTDYKSVIKIGQKTVNKLLSLTDLDDTGIEELTSSLADYFINKQDEKENTTTVVKKYLMQALKKRERLVVIFDNFSQCDVSSIDVIASLTHEFLNNESIRFIFSTTKEDLENRFDIKSVLAEKIRNKPVEITEFKEKQLFVRMLEHSFDLNEQNISLLSQAFELCHGVPQRFKEILINLYASQGIEINSAKARFVTDTFRKIMVKKEISFDVDSLCQKQKSAKIILQVTALWGEPISCNVLLQFLKYYSNVDFIPLLEDDIRETLQFLENTHVLSKTYSNNIVLYQFEHDSLKIAVNDYFADDRSVPFLHFNIYCFIKTLDAELKLPYWHQYYHSLLACHSFASQADGWIDYNYSYGYGFFEKCLYQEAHIIFSRLESAAATLSGEQLLNMGITFFYCGQYRKANDIFKNILSNGLHKNFSDELMITLHIFLSRSYCCILDVKNALDTIAEAEKLSIADERLNIMVLGARQSILFLSPNGFHKAKELFDKLKMKDIHVREMALIYQSAMDYYEGEQAKELLYKGLSLAKEFSDEITEAKILNNLGFEHLRCGEYEQAKKHLLKSIRILEKMQPHEQSYPYSNLAVLYMIERHWEQALSSIIEALFWNKSDYVSLVLKINRMICYYYLNNPEWENIYDELYKYIQENRSIDDKIYKKIGINTAILAFHTGNRIDAQAILKLCEPHLENEWAHGKYRFLKLKQQLSKKEEDLPKPTNSCHMPYYCELDFEPWLVTFTHD